MTSFGSGESRPELAQVEARSTSSPHASSSSANPVSSHTPTAEAARKVAIAVDLSDDSAYIVKWAADHFLRPRDDVVLLHFDSSTTSKATELAQPLIDAKVPYKIQILKDYDMKERLCLEVERLGFTFVIMGTRGFRSTSRGGDDKLGSVSDYFVNHCVCPVVVVRHPDEKAGNGVCQAIATVTEAEEEGVEEEHQDASHECRDKMRVDPGPRSSAVLTRQAQHRSDDVWHGADYTNAVFKTREHISHIRKDWKVDDRMLHYVKMAGFYGIHRLGSTYTLDRALVTALIERWRPETHTFHFTVGEATITLQDVAVLLGLKVHGRAVTGTANLVWASVVENLLGVAPPDDILGGSSLKAKWLHQQFSQLPPNADEQTVQCYSRAYILALMGGVVFSDMSGGDVQLIYLPLLSDLELAGEYSWGSALLAYLYRQLCRAAHKNKKEIAGPLILLQLWAWERIPIGRPRCTHPLMKGVEDDGPPSFGPTFEDGRDSLACRWLRVSYTYAHSATSLGYYRDALDNQREDQFTWEPYTEDVFAKLADICGSDPHIWRTQSPMICFDIVEWHRPDRVMRQFGLVQFRPNACDYNSDLHQTDRRGKPHHDWAHVHATYIQQWNHREDMIMSSPPFATNLQAYTDYMSWYRQITRLIISSPSRPPSMHYQPTSPSLHTMARCLSDIAERGRQSAENTRQLQQEGDIHALARSYKEFTDYVVTQCRDALGKASLCQYYSQGRTSKSTPAVPTSPVYPSPVMAVPITSINPQSLNTNGEEDEMDDSHLVQGRGRRGRGRAKVRRRQ